MQNFINSIDKCKEFVSRNLNIENIQIVMNDGAHHANEFTRLYTEFSLEVIRQIQENRQFITKMAIAGLVFGSAAESVSAALYRK